MKKLMFAVAALVAGVACADGITSQNVVGYQTIDTNAGNGFTMIAPTFLGVGSDTECTLADLKVTGYEPAVWDADDEEYVGGCKGTFVLRLLKADGSYDGVYYWVDDGEVAPGWYKNSLGATIPGGAASVKIAAGRGLWVSGKGMSLVPAGQVNAADIAFVTNSGSGFTAAGNAMPVDTTLDKLFVTGYDPAVWDADDEEYVGGCKGTFVLRLLKADGSYDGVYYWVDDGEVTPGWYKNSLGAAIPGGAASVTIAAGRGLWCSGKGMTLNIPSPIAAE